MKKILKIIFIPVIFFGLFGITKNSEAAPSISGVSGNVMHGSNVTVSGSGFGTKNPSLPWLWDAVEKWQWGGSVENSYGPLANGAAIPTWCTYGTSVCNGSVLLPWVQTSGMRYDIVDAQRHGFSTAMYRNNAIGQPDQMNLDDSFGHERRVGGGSTDQVYVTWWYKPSTSPETYGNSNKFLRAGDTDWANQEAMISWRPSQLILYNNKISTYCANEWPWWGGADSTWDPPISDSGPGHVGQWNRLEWFYSRSSHSMWVYVNGALIGNTSWSPSCSDKVADIISMIGLDYNNEAPMTGYMQYMDDIYIDKSFARVEICPEATWEKRGKCEIQRATNWSSSSLAITVNQAVFTSGQQAYLYVVDSIGAVNSSGYPVTIGGGGGGDTTPTGSPLNLTVR